MTHYFSINLRLSNSQLDELKLATKTLDKSPIKMLKKLILKISEYMVGYTNNETNFLHELLLINDKS